MPKQPTENPSENVSTDNEAVENLNWLTQITDDPVILRLMATQVRLLARQRSASLAIANQVQRQEAERIVASQLPRDDEDQPHSVVDRKEDGNDKK